MKNLKWKRAGNDGEIEATHKGNTWRVRKNYDHNDRHTGEYRIEIKKKNPYGGHDWHWHDTVSGKNHAKTRLPEEVTTTADAGIPHDTKNMGPTYKAINMVDRRRKKDKSPVLLKRFRKYMEDHG